MRVSSLALAYCLASVFVGCGDDSRATPGSGSGGGATIGKAGSPGTGAATAERPTPSSADPATPEAFPNGLLLAYAQFVVENGQVTARPGPARLVLLRREGGEWVSRSIEDPQSNVFHKAMVYTPQGGEPSILTLGGMTAAVKLWREGDDGWSSRTLWTEDFGGRFNRMRDAEVADLYGDGKPAIVVGTHDQGVVAVLRPGEGDSFDALRLDHQANTFIHEIEIGDLDGDGTLEVYATPSEPNTLEGGAQHGQVVRYVPRTQGRRTVVADLGNRHAKEILVADVDGDGRDELYVAVEALTEGSGQSIRIVEPVEIRRYDQGTPPDQGIRIATINDRFTRFLTAGDLDGDGKDELVAAAFSSGLWLLEPGSNPRGEWSVESIDRESSGFEHASVIADLDGDGRDELYVAADEQGEVRRYVWRDGRPRRETIYRRELPRSMMTWNIMPAPAFLLAPPAAR